MEERARILNDFSACMLCGRVLATVVAKLGDQSLTTAIQEREGSWLSFAWHPSFSQALVEFYDWEFEPEVTHQSGHCPLCRRRIVFQTDEQEDTARLLLETWATRR